MKEFSPLDIQLTRRKALFWLATSTASLAAAACAPRTTTQSPQNESGKLSIQDRVVMPQEMIRATEEAARPTPTPDRRFEKPRVSDIKIERELLSHCGPDPRYDPTGNDMWGGWIVKLDNPNYYLRNGKFELELLTPSGGLITRKPVPNVKLASGVVDYIPAWIDPAPKHKAMFGARAQTSVNGAGSELGSVKLKMTGPMEWAVVDGSVKEYQWQATYDGGGYTDSSVSPMGKPYLRSRSSPPMNFWVKVENNSERAIENIGVFGFFVDGEGQLVDALMGSAPKIPYGTTTRIEARSLSDGGRCTGEGVPKELMYWVFFETYTGMPVVKHEVIR